jgi:serine/threonine protein kinase/WD40 repeat protein
VAGYLIEERIGAGGMAVVYRARDEVLGRLAAVKVLSPALASDEEFRIRFLRESRAVAAVDDPHIIPVYAAGEAGGVLYIATRFIVSGDLAALLRRAGGTLSPDRAMALVSQVASALDAAHAAGLVHRDVKPGNILVDIIPGRPERAYLSDFGLSKGALSSTGLTAAGQFLGTPDYCAPEQIRGDAVDGRADQYALACAAFVLLVGIPPFHRDEAVATLFAHIQDPAPLVTGLRPELPIAADGVIARALAKSPADRYDCCAEFAAALREALTPARPVTAPDPRPRSGEGDAVARTSGSQGPSPRDSASPASPPDTVSVGRKDLGYASTVTGGGGGGGSAGQAQEPETGGQGRPPRHRHRRTAFIGGTAALALAAAGIIYAVTLPSGSSPAPKRPSKPTLAATLTVPGGDAVDYSWFSQDGKLMGAASTSKIYIWDAESGTYLTTLTVPDIAVGTVSYKPILYSIAFGTDDASLTASVGPSFPKGAHLPSSVPYFVYRWNLATGAQTTIGSISAPVDSVIFSGDSSTAFIVLSKADIRVATLGHAERTITLPGASTSIQGADQDGNRVIYYYVTKSAATTTYALDVENDKVIASIDDASGITASSSLSPDGKTVLVAPAWLSGTTNRPFALWDVDTRSNISPTDPWWRQQTESSYPKFSTDGSVIATTRAGGKTDLWDIPARKYLLTITDPDYRTDTGGEFVGPGGSEVVFLGSQVAANGGSRQLRLWETPLSP